jgi:hypothetical protein
VIGASSTTTISPAFADEALARQHFKKGIELYDKKDYANALTAFQDAYKEKPSAGIKQNIALCLKGLGKPAEAATSFDEALEEGKGTLKPETQKSIERELADLSKTVATVVFMTTVDDGKPLESAVITIESAASGEKPRTLPAGAQRRSVRLMPGIYTFRARAPGYPDPPEKKLALVSGQPVEATFAFGGNPLAVGAPGQQGTLTIKTSHPDAAIRVDGVDVGRGTFIHAIAAGTHRVEVSLPGFRTANADVTVSPGAVVEYPVTLQPVADAPPEYVPAAAAPLPKSGTSFRRSLSRRSAIARASRSANPRRMARGEAISTVATSAFGSAIIGRARGRSNFKERSVRSRPNTVFTGATRRTPRRR